MKKILLFASALAGLFLAASCQQENLEPVGGNTVTYTVQVPDALATKALGDDITNINVLHYEVYRTEVANADGFTTADNLLYHKTAPMNNGTATISLELVNDQNYTVLFWAQAGEANEAYDVTDLTNVTVKSSLKANQESYAAFTGVDFIVEGKNLAGRTVTLERPIAQINIATTPESLNGNGAFVDAVVLEGSSVTVAGLSNSFNVAKQAPGAEMTTTYEFAEQAVPTATLEVNGKNYTYVAMNYVGFADEVGNNVKVSYVINTSEGDIDNDIENVPVKPNYRTNIVGNLLTSNADYTVEIKPGFDTPSEDVELWDGKTLNAPDFDPATSTWTIDNGAELAWLANAVNETLPSTRAGEAETETTPVYESGDNVVLGADINLGDREWTPIGVGGKRFSGTFDGKGHIISNFKITTKHAGKEQAALFGNLAGTVIIKDLTVEKADVVYPGQGDFYGAALVATAYGNVAIENVTVRDSYISGNNKVAGLLAHDGVVSSLNINNCHVLNCKIESLNAEDGGNVGGLVGLLQAGVVHSIKNSSVKKTVINGINSSNTGKRANGEFVACVYGKDALTLKIEKCEVADNTFTQNEGVTYVSPYGVFVGGRREEGGMPTIIVDNKEMIQDGLIKEENTFSVTTAESLQTALEQVSEGDIIKLENDIIFETGANGSTNGISYTGAASFTLDLNGKTVTSNLGNNALRFKIGDGNDVKDKQVTITIKNGSVVSGDANWCAISAATADNSGNKLILNLEDLEVINSKAGDFAVKSWAGAVVNAKDVEVTSSYGGGFYAAGGEITLDNCTAVQTGMHTAPYNSMALAVSSGGKMTVNSGSYSSVPAAAADGNGQGTSHGCWVAGVMNSGGTLIINDGTFANGNYGEDALATAPRGAILADLGADIKINGGTFDALKNVIDIPNNLGDASRNPKVILAGGNFSSDPCTYEGLISVAEGYVVAAPETEGGYYTIKEYRPAAKVGNTEYGSIDEAIANWTNNTTLTLLDDVTLSDVVTLKSTEHHILDLGTFTMTAAESKNAFVIQACGTGSAERYAITIKADATNPGGINAGQKCIVYYKYADGGISTDDRPIIKIEGGVFTGSTSSLETAGIYTIGSAARKCATLNISGGTFNCSINGSSKSKLLISGGVFNYSVGSQGDSTALRLIWGGKFKTIGFMTADSNNTKFWFGTSMGNSDVGLYINDEGYLVVGGSVITDFGDKFKAKATNATKWSSYLQYSSAADNGLYYTNAELAITKHGEANVVLP